MKASSLGCCLPDRQRQSPQHSRLCRLRSGSAASMPLVSPAPTSTSKPCPHSSVSQCRTVPGGSRPVAPAQHFWLKLKFQRTLVPPPDIMNLGPWPWVHISLPADHSFHASWFDIRRLVPQGFMALTAARICRSQQTPYEPSRRLAAFSLSGHGHMSNL